jgi:hypothetical protein
MAFQKQLVKLTSKECYVKIWGVDGDEGDILLSELKMPDEVLTGTQKVHIAGYQWSGESTTTFYVTRNNVQICTFSASTIAGGVEMTGATCPPDPVAQDQNIHIRITGGIGELFIRLRKQDGYTTKYDTSTLGVYDNINTIGS